MMVMIQAMVETLKIPLMLVVDHQVYLATTQGKLVDQLVTHFSLIKIQLNHQGHNLQGKGSGVEIIPLNLLLVILMLVSGVEVLQSNECLFSGFVSQSKPKKVKEALADPDWVIAMQGELNQCER